MIPALGLTPLDRPLTLDEAGHLLRRTGFVATPDALKRAQREGPVPTVRRLLGGTTPKACEVADLAERTVAHAETASPLGGTLLLRVVLSEEPLRENLVLFFHNHFVSGHTKVQHSAFITEQFALFRRLGGGSFSALTKAVSRNPAMVRYLDLERSTKASPNENFARELLELFTLGAGESYDENDVKEAARAFTGYQLRRERFRYSESAHDDGEKTVLGKRGRLTGDDVINACVAHPSTARFLASKVLRHFVTDEPTPSLIQRVADTWRDRHGNMGLVLERLFASQEFFETSHRFALTRSPAALIGATCRALGDTMPFLTLARHGESMGQVLADPPTVEGYAGGSDWMNPATLLARRGFLLETVESLKDERTAELLPNVTETDVRTLASWLLGHSLSENEARAVTAFARSRDLPRRRREALGALLLHPTFQRA